VVFLAVRSYFVLCLVARQSVLIDGEPPKDSSFVFPIIPLIMTALQFVFYVGWMKVAESLMNPLGEDDDDFECNYLLDRNLSVKTIEPLYSADTAIKPIYPQLAPTSKPREDEVIMMPRVDADEMDNMSFDDQEARLLPRGTL
ncbi:hypothetical protein OSTOST_19283, partial [Ostertagia ostertagi]